jgi:cation:H+ antiporter
MAEVHSQEAEAFQYTRIGTRRTVAVFALSAAAVVAFGIWLASVGDRLSAQTGLSRSFVGNLFLAVSTSLPEVAASMAAVRIGAIDMAIGNALGSNLFNILLLAVFDLTDMGRPFWPVLSEANAFSAMMAVCLTAVVIISLVYRASPKTPFRLNWDGAILLAGYCVTMGILFMIG